MFYLNHFSTWRSKTILIRMSRYIWTELKFKRRPDFSETQAYSTKFRGSNRNGKTCENGIKKPGKRRSCLFQMTTAGNLHIATTGRVPYFQSCRLVSLV